MRGSERQLDGGNGGRRNLGRLLRVTAAFACGLVAFPTQAADPVMFRTVAGRFEVAALDGGAASSVSAMADEGWKLLAVPLALPDAFSSSILVRLVPAAEWTERTPFRVFVEPGGIVSVRIRWDATPDGWMIRRALVQGLLMRQAVAFHGVVAKLAAPLWLELGAVGWWHSRLDGANLDGLKQETASLSPPSMAELLTWQRGATEPASHSIGSVWLLSFLQTESGATEWKALLRRFLGGDDPLVAMTAAFPGRFNDEAQRELWWQTGWHHLRRTQTLPGLSAAESRAALEAISRFVVLDEAGHETVAAVRDVLGFASELWVDVELLRRTTELNRIVPSLHPFYRNAGLSLTLALAARGPAAKREEICRAFESDWRDARELEAATTAALDQLERHQRG